MIGNRAFAENHRLKKARFPESLNRIGRECYRECNHLLAAEFCKSSPLHVIPEGIFDSCIKLSHVVLPEKVEIIKQRAFYRCKELKNLDSRTYYFRMRTYRTANGQKFYSSWSKVMKVKK